MNMLDVKDLKWLEDSVADIKKISEKISVEAPQIVAEKEEAPKSGFAKMKAFVRKAVDCCIE